MTSTISNRTEIETRIRKGEEILAGTDEINLPLMREPAQNWYEEILSFLQSYNTDEQTKQEAVAAVTEGANYHAAGMFGGSVYVPLESNRRFELDEFQEKIRLILNALRDLPLY